MLPRVRNEIFRVPTGFVGKIIGRNFYNRESLVKNSREANAGEWNDRSSSALSRNTDRRVERRAAGVFLHHLAPGRTDATRTRSTTTPSKRQQLLLGPPKPEAGIQCAHLHFVVVEALPKELLTDRLNWQIYILPSCTLT